MWDQMSDHGILIQFTRYHFISAIKHTSTKVKFLWYKEGATVHVQKGMKDRNLDEEEKDAIASALANALNEAGREKGLKAFDQASIKVKR